MMKASKLRDLTIDDLELEQEELSRQLFQLRLQKATGQLDNVSKIKAVRHDLARVKTVITEKEEKNA